MHEHYGYNKGTVRLTHSVYSHACLLRFTGSEPKVVLVTFPYCQQEPVLFVCESTARVVAVFLGPKHRTCPALLGLSTALIRL